MAASSWREPTPAERLVWVLCSACGKRQFQADASGRVVLVCRRCKVFQTQDLKRS